MPDVPTEHRFYADLAVWWPLISPPEEYEDEAAVDYMTSEADLRHAIETAFVHCRPGGIAVLIPDHTAETFEAASDHGGNDDPPVAVCATWNGPGRIPPTPGPPASNRMLSPSRPTRTGRHASCSSADDQAGRQDAEHGTPRTT